MCGHPGTDMQITPGKVALEAEKAKYDRYGSGQGGVYVTPAAVESWGRFGREFDYLLRLLEARWAWVRRAGASMADATGRGWRAELGVAQVRALLVTCMRAVGRHTYCGSLGR